MNLINFLNTVDSMTAVLSKDALAMFVHNLARALPEEDRDHFLTMLNGLGNALPDCDPDLLADVDTVNLQDELLLIREKLLQIDNGELCLLGDLNEEYDDWYDSCGDEFIFSDPNGVADILEDACRLVHQCVDRELYKEGYELSEQLFTLDIEIEGEYVDYCGSNFDLRDIEDNQLADLDYRQLVLDALYAAYKTHTMEERADVLFCILNNSRSYNITLENLLQTGHEELDQFPEFLGHWIEYLGKLSGKNVDKLLLEAVHLQNDSARMLELARKYSRLHPGLYEMILKQGQMSDETQFQVGMEAISAISPQYVIRSRIALMTAACALRMDLQEDAQQCWLEAFRSDTRPVHYLRLMIESEDFSKYRDEARRIYQLHLHKLRKTTYAISPDSELSQNDIDRPTYEALAFFDGDFQHVISKGMDCKEALGWTGTFMKEGIELFLLYLYQGDRLPVGCEKMCHRITQALGFTSEAYFQGLNARDHREDAALFWECFVSWKKMNTISEPEQNDILERLDAWIRLRVKGIMENNRRNYYGECAEFIAALGEVMESRGERGGKARLLEDYRSAYSRRSAFHSELRAYGMRDTRKR